MLCATMASLLLVLLATVVANENIITYTGSAKIVSNKTALVEYELNEVHVGGYPGAVIPFFLTTTTNDVVPHTQSSEQISRFFHPINNTHFSDVFYIAGTRFTNTTFQYSKDDSSSIPLSWFIQRWPIFSICATTDTTGIIALTHSEIPVRCRSLKDDVPPLSIPCSNPAQCEDKEFVISLGLRHIITSYPATINSQLFPSSVTAAVHMPMTENGVILDVVLPQSSNSKLAIYGTAVPQHSIVFNWDRATQTATMFPAVLPRSTSNDTITYISVAVSVVLIVLWVTHIMAIKRMEAWTPSTIHVSVEIAGIAIAYVIICVNLWNSRMVTWVIYSAPITSSRTWSHAIIALMFIGVTIATVASITLLFFPSHTTFITRTAMTETVVLSAFIVQLIGETTLTYEMLLCAVTALAWTCNKAFDICNPAVSTRYLVASHVLLCLPYFILGGIYPLVEHTDEFAGDVVLATITTTLGAISVGMVGCIEQTLLPHRHTKKV